MSTQTTACSSIKPLQWVVLFVGLFLVTTILQSLIGIIDPAITQIDRSVDLRLVNAGVGLALYIPFIVAVIFYDKLLFPRRAVTHQQH